MGNRKQVILPHNQKMDSALYQEVLEKSLKTSMRMTGTKIYAGWHTLPQMQEDEGLV